MKIIQLTALLAPFIAAVLASPSVLQRSAALEPVSTPSRCFIFTAALNVLVGAGPARMHHHRGVPGRRTPSGPLQGQGTARRGRLPGRDGLQYGVHRLQLPYFVQDRALNCWLRMDVIQADR
ncbi:hypothetical protein B0H13DRAFT_1998033 [Mycena leptocephala]|nr:hypothetical protein B0H13DRAFT_1998033 [Mycena leptocephala]